MGSKGVEMAFEVAVILALIVANGAFAMSEIALVSARKARLQRLANEGRNDAKVALELANAPNRFLSTVQFGITLVGIFAGAFGGATIAGKLAVFLHRYESLEAYSESISFGIVVLVLTYLSLILGELVPKRLALGNAEGIACFVAKPMRLLSNLAKPAITLLGASTEAVLKIIGITPSDEPPVTEEELRILIGQGARAGVLKEMEQDMLESVLRLKGRKVTALMTHRTEIAWLDAKAPVEVNRAKIIRSSHSYFPVCIRKLDEVVGIAHSKDILSRQLQGLELDIKGCMKPPLFVPRNKSALAVLDLLRSTGTHVALVLDEYGGVMGLVTVNDILGAVVGESITAENTGETATKREDGTWLLDGTLQLDEFKHLFNFSKLPGEEAGNFTTLGGFIVSHLGHIPEPAEYFGWGGHRFEVVDMDGRRVDKVLFSPAGTWPSSGNSH